MAAPTKYDYDKKLQVCNAFVVFGMSSIKAGKYCQVPHQTIRSWTKTDWWRQMVQEVRARHQDRLDGKFTAMIDRAHEEIWERLANGDEQVLAKTGEIVRRKVSARDVADILNKVMMLRSLMRGEPTSRTATSTMDTKLQGMQKKLEAFQEEKRQIEKEVERDDEHVTH